MINIWTLHLVGSIMGSSKNQQLTARRRILQNPYAHIEDLEQPRTERLHENPHLYADRQGTDDVAHAKSRKAHDISTIEQIATKLQREIWAERVELGLPPDIHPVELLQAEYAARLLGYSYSSHPSLGWIMRGRNQIVVAGLIDNSKRTIEVATDVEPRVARFTSAHEIGHAVLHPHLAGLHRDRPLSGATESRDRIEYEADKFATFFLMPWKLVTEQFLSRFITPFELQEQTAYALLGKPYSVVRKLLPTRRHVSRALANAIQFNGRNFTSLSEYFGLTTEAMAIRLEELGLVDG